VELLRSRKPVKFTQRHDEVADEVGELVGGDDDGDPRLSLRVEMGRSGIKTGGAAVVDEGPSHATRKHSFHIVLVTRLLGHWSSPRRRLF
jgi:hypothetical protein